MSTLNLGTKLKEYRTAQQSKYFNDYWGNAVNAYGNYDGRILWDASSNSANWSQPSSPLPNLSAMWSQYSKGARSRGIEPDFMTFKKYYDTLNVTRKAKFTDALNSASLSGIPVEKIQDMLRKNPGLKDDLIKTINATPDENQKANLASYLPEQQKTAQQVLQESQGLFGGALIAGGMGAAYAFSPDAKRQDAAKKALTEANKKYRQGIKDINTEMSDWDKKNPKPKPEGRSKDSKGKVRPGTKAQEAKYKKDLAKWKADRLKFETDQGHQQTKSELSADKRAAKRESMRADKTRVGSYLKGKFGKGSPGGLARTAGAAGLWVGAPMATGALAKAMGFDEATQQAVSEYTGHAIAAGYTTKQIAPAVQNVLKVKKAGGSPKAMANAFKKTPKNKLALTLMAASYILPWVFGGDEEADQTVYQVTTQPSSGTKSVKDYQSPI